MKKSVNFLICTALLFGVMFGLAACRGDGGGGEQLPIYKVTVEGGSGGGNYYDGTNVTVTAQIPPGKQFMMWTVAGEGVSTNAVFVFTVRKDTVVTAVFADTVPDIDELVYTVSVTGGTVRAADESAAEAKPSASFAAGTRVTVTAGVVLGQKFTRWTTPDGKMWSQNQHRTFLLGEHLELTAQFIGSTPLPTPPSVDTPNGPSLIRQGPNAIELDRTNPSFMATTGNNHLFIDYILFYIYDSYQAEIPVAMFKMVPNRDRRPYMDVPYSPPGGWLRTMDDSVSIEVHGHDLNYWVPSGNAFERVIETALGSAHEPQTEYYFAAQLISLPAVYNEELSIWTVDRADSAISQKSTWAYTLP
ncbi:MAG: hypothetical protein FWH03_07395 [Firmicutes bacterium]|nr:hypothetical protein [Bacillota bacterium]